MVDLTGARVVDVKEHHKSALGTELIDVAGGGVWNELHVGLVNRSKAANRRAIKHLAYGEEFFIHG